jgi:hypothetical protein
MIEVGAEGQPQQFVQVVQHQQGAVVACYRFGPWCGKTRHNANSRSRNSDMLQSLRQPGPAAHGKTDTSQQVNEYDSASRDVFEETLGIYSVTSVISFHKNAPPFVLVLCPCPCGHDGGLAAG